MATRGRTARCRHQLPVAQRREGRMPVGFPRRVLGEKVLDEEEFVHDVQSLLAWSALGICARARADGSVAMCLFMNFDQIIRYRDI
jgi:hypothetical protein